MRLFTALDLPDPVAGNLEELLEKLRPQARIQWSPVTNLHITTKFIGEWPEARLDELQAALAAIEPRPPITVVIEKLGFFPNARSPRVFWCGVESLGLANLAAATERATSSLGIRSEERAFSPHLTLARIKERIDFKPLHEAIGRLASVEFGRFTADGFFLYQSKLHRSGSVYTKVAEFPFSRS
ncbi:MAG: RNA 2',3'-cyclic phosphodiesterase [Acidobacteriia bacterium]|nr:RNA 2',3'-cyclic phosphodiesterase [Terriglobia bacterium]